MISGNSDLVVSSGTTTINSDSSGYNGDIFITGGLLSVNGTLGTHVSVSNIGRVEGNGFIDNLIIDNGGTLAPGNSIGTTNVANATFNPGSNYEVEVNEAGQSDLLNATGTVTINGGNVEAIPFPDYALYTPYTIITAAGGVGGVFDSVSDNFILFDGTLSYDANNVYLTLIRSAAADVIVQTPNQRAVNGALFEVSGTNDAVRAFYRLTDIQGAQEALDQLSGEIHPVAGTAMIDETHRVRRALPQAPERIPPSSPSRLWITGLGSTGKVDSTYNTASVERSGGGILGGVDFYTDKGGRYGLGLGISENKLDIDDRASSADMNSYHINSGLSASIHSIDTKRGISFPGFNGNSQASYHGQTGHAFVGISKDIPLREAKNDKGASVTPYIETSITTNHTGSFEEDGDAGLKADGQWNHTGAVTVGADYTHRFKLGATPVKFITGLGWQHTIGNTGRASDQSFNNPNAQDFTVYAAPYDHNTALIKTELNIDLSDTANASLNYHGNFSCQRNDQSISARINWTF